MYALAKFSMMLGGGTAAAADAAITFAAAAVSTSDLTTYTFAGHSIGTAASDRHVMVAVAIDTNAARTISTVTVAGQSCTQAVYVQVGTAAAAGIYITDAPVTSGTTADVVVTCSGAVQSCGIGTCAVTGLSSTTATDTATATTDFATVTLDLLAGGVAVSVAAWTSSGSGTMDWTGLSGMTERYDAAVEGTTQHHSGATTTSATTQTLSLRADANNSPTNEAVAYASFR